MLAFTHFEFFEDDLQITLWNPSKRKSHTLLVSEIEFPPRSCYLEFVVFEFGYDNVSDDYKLVRMVQFAGMDKFIGSEVKVYSLKANSWRRITYFPFFHWNRCFLGILVSNALHWVVWTELEGVNPEKLLGCFCSGNRGTPIWVKKEYGVKESWTKLFSVSVTQHDDVVSSVRFVEPLAYSKCDNKVLLNLGGKS
ncbi:hypothetical protein PTKIN_Ptkin11bG0095900 [Pterospermum kingtungense]